jgi:predicted transcriptional regulator
MNDKEDQKIIKYYMIPGQVGFNSLLQETHKNVFWLIFSLSKNNGGITNITNDKISKLLNISKSTTIRCINKLVVMQYLKKDVMRSKKNCRILSVNE